MRQALVERADLIEARAAAVLDQALLAGEPWTRALGTPPRGSAAACCQNGFAVAAYRDRYGIVGTKPLGALPESTAQKLDAARARDGLFAAQRLARNSFVHDEPSLAASLPVQRICL